MNQTWKPKPGDVTAKKKSCSTRFHTTSRLFTPPDQKGEIPRCHPTCVTTPDKKQRVRVPLPLLFLGCWHTEETILMVAQSP